MFTGACTEDEDCKNATIETSNDNCASLRHYPHEEHLRTSLGFSEENAATKESFEDETQLGNFQHKTSISLLLGSVKVILLILERIIMIRNFNQA